jgi:5'-3' exonuclease
MLSAFSKSFQKQRIVFLWDSRQSWRIKVYPDYKINRRDPDRAPIKAEVYKQIDIFRELLSVLGMTQIEVAGLEADDLAGILLEPLRGQEVILISSDKDWYQLLDPGVRIVKFWTGANLVWVDPEWVWKKHRVKVKNWASFQALTGDKTDNIPNVRPQLGPATARKLLAGTFLSLTTEEEKIFQRNLKLTTILRHVDGLDAQALLKTRKHRHPNKGAWDHLGKILIKYELFELWQKRRLIWEVSQWR